MHSMGLNNAQQQLTVGGGAATNVDSDMDSEMSGSNQKYVYGAMGPNQMGGNTSFNVVASDSETDGNFSDTGSQFGRGTTMRGDGGDDH